MTESEAVVTRLDGDHVWLDVDKTACSSCGESGACGLNEGKGRRQQRVRNSVGARVGDRVIISVPDGAVLRAVFHCYLLPLMTVLAAAAGGMALGGEPGSIMGAAVGLAVGWLAMRRAGQREPVLTIRIKDAVVYLHRNRQT